MAVVFHVQSYHRFRDSFSGRVHQDWEGQRSGRVRRTMSGRVGMRHLDVHRGAKRVGKAREKRCFRSREVEA